MLLSSSNLSNPTDNDSEVQTIFVGGMGAREKSC